MSKIGSTKIALLWCGKGTSATDLKYIINWMSLAVRLSHCVDFSYNSTGSCWLRQSHGRECKLQCKTVHNIAHLPLLGVIARGQWTLSRLHMLTLCSKLKGWSRWNTCQMQGTEWWSMQPLHAGDQARWGRADSAAAPLLVDQYPIRGLTYTIHWDAVTAQDIRHCKGYAVSWLWPC